MTTESLARCDVLIISPHTDDAEIGLGGTIRLLANRGRNVWALDLTAGELGTNATADERWREAERASVILGLSGRVQLRLPDGFIDSRDAGQAGQVAAILRRVCPRWVITAPDPVRHPDHIETPALVRKAVYLSRLRSWQPELGERRLWAEGGDLPEPESKWIVDTVASVSGDCESPSMLFDVGDVWQAKTAALACYGSQFGRTDGQITTAINDPAFLEKIERRARTWGRIAGVELAEAVSCSAVPVLRDLPSERWQK